MSFRGCDVNEFQLAGDIRFDGELFAFFESKVGIPRSEEVAEGSERGRVVGFFVEYENNRVAGLGVLDGEFGALTRSIPFF